MHEVFIEKKMLLFSMAMPGIAGIVWLDLSAPRSLLNTCTCCGYFEQPTANTKSVQKDFGRCRCGVDKISGIHTARLFALLPTQELRNQEAWEEPGNKVTPMQMHVSLCCLEILCIGTISSP